MFKTHLATLLTLSFTFFTAGPIDAKVKASSEIPAQREFPLSDKVSPCQDFHQYVCSEAEAAFKLREDRSIHTFAFNDSSERILQIKMSFMKDIDKLKDLDPRTQQIQNFYLSCMDAKGRAAEEKTFVANSVKEIGKIDSVEALLRLNNEQLGRRLGGFVSLFASNNVENPLRMDATLLSNLMLLPNHDYYENEEIVKAMTELLKDFLRAVVPKISSKEAQIRAEKLMVMQKDFIKEFPRPAVRRERWSEKRTLTQKQFASTYPQLQAALINIYLPSAALVNIPVPEGLDFIKNKLATYDLQTWKDYLLVDTLMDHLDEAYPIFFQRKFDLDKKYFGGPAKRSDRQERCTRLASRYFARELDAALFAKVFPDFNEEKVQLVAKKIRESIIDGLKKNKWLDKKSKNGAMAKIKKARLQLVKPHNDREWDFLPLKKYDPKHFIGNLLTYREARWEKNMAELRAPANQDAWGMGPLTVNAYYNPSENKFVLPAGILQFPFYNANGDIIENLGAVGAVVGHELGHGIDDQGSRYDAQGKLSPWMSQKSLEEFQRRGQRMVEQFNEAGYDGKLTLGENVADLVGLTFAYQAAFPQNKGSQEDKQRFFVSYGRLWCSVVRPDFASLLIKTDPHAAGPARINEQVKHQAAFAEAFQCKPGDKMVLPEKERLQIW